MRASCPTCSTATVCAESATAGDAISTLFRGLYDPGTDTPPLVHARALALPRLGATPEHGFYLASIRDRLCLCRAGQPLERGLCVDFAGANIRRRIAAGRRMPLARALGLHRRLGVHVLDATCGLGRDSAVLAGLGCTVTAIERHPALHALLADGLRRGRALAGEWFDNWQALHYDEAANWLVSAGKANAFDAIYIDPMFDNARRKARPQRALQWLGQLLDGDDDAPQLLAAARTRALQRVVVKNHARAAPLAPPDHQIRGRATRFDVYIA